jgi:DNA (cytosine-5)-methyltransferase 1
VNDHREGGMRFGSICSGIEAASVAWESLGWSAAFFAEIDPLCCALLAERLPDRTKILET